MATVEKKLRTDSPAKLSELFDRQPPRSLEAERALIGSLLLLPEACDEVALLVRPEDFYDTAHRTIFTHMVALHESGRQIDPTLLSQLLKDAGQYENVGGAAFLLELSQEVATAAHAEHYARIIRDKAVLRSLIHASTDIIHEAYEPGIDARNMLSRAEARVFGILSSKGETQVRTIREVLHESLARIDARLQQQHAYGGLETGFIDLDELTGGLHNSELFILAARPSMGKTAFAINIAEHVSIGTNKPVLVVSLEMSALELGDRLLCSRARVNSHRLRNGQLSREDSGRLIQTAADISRAPLYIDDSPSRNMTEIAATARRLKRADDGKGLALVVIDYLQLIEPDNPRDPRQEQVARISRRLKGLARELSVPILCLAQLNRQVEATRDNRPQLSHLRESGAIEQDADVVAFVHREEFYQTNEEDRQQFKGQAELLIRKQRNGPIGDIKLTWLHDFTRFENFQQPEYDEFADFGPDSLP